jgi:hypothetical protein
VLDRRIQPATSYDNRVFCAAMTHAYSQIHGEVIGWSRAYNWIGVRLPTPIQQNLCTWEWLPDHHITCRD